MKIWIAIIILSKALTTTSFAVEAFYGNAPHSSRQELGIAPQVRIEVSLAAKADEVTLRTSRIFLGDLFDCMAPALVCREIQAVDLGRSPEPGQVRAVSLEDIIKPIEDDLGKSYETHVDGPNTIRLRSESLEINRELIEGELLQALNSQLNPNRRISIRSLYVRNGLRVYPGELQWEFLGLDSVVDELNSFQSGTPKLHELGLRLSSRYGGVVSDSEISLRVRLQILMRVPVAAATLPFGDLVRPENFVMEWVEINHEPVLDLHAVRGMRLTRRILKGQFLRKSDVNEPFLIQKGQAVDVILISGGIQLRSQARALSSGRLGESVPIQLAHNRKQLSGEVVSSSTVKVVE